MQPLRIALAQIAPALGLLDQNIERHRGLLAAARACGADLVVFPELGLTGYLLQDLAPEVAMHLDDPRIGRLADDTRGLSAEDGEVRAVHRKLFLPTYGLFDERRFFAAGDSLRAFPSRLGVPVGISICEDFWHPVVPSTLALDGAQILVNVSSSPGRDIASTHEEGLGTAASWRQLVRTYAQLTTSFVVFCNRVGIDETIGFWGGSEVVGPDGSPLLSAPLYDEGLFVADVELADVRRERIGLPLLRDERPEIMVRELQRIVAERASLAPDDDGAQASPVMRAASRTGESR